MPTGLADFAIFGAYLAASKGLNVIAVAIIATLVSMGGALRDVPVGKVLMVLKREIYAQSRRWAAWSTTSQRSSPGHKPLSPASLQSSCSGFSPMNLSLNSPQG